ncbi:MAG: LysR substrate-binding domain-containing protein [Proteobacteria bacterium]|jgi:LysR family transcriptional activator of nhaA|nr:LysR substrate-binding domain-containing protein [Pseudomonadota bacterium]
MHNLNYHHLFYFKVIATEGSISKAAQKLRLGQPTLSMQLKQFEDNLGHALFERRNRTLVLTEMGRLVLGYANEIFRLGEEMIDAVNDRPTTKKMKLQIGALDSVPKSVIQECMRKAYEFGDCSITVLEGEGSDLMNELVNHRLDLVISNASAPSLTTEKLFAKSLAKLQLVIVGHPKFKNLKELFPKSLNQAPFIYPTSHSRVRHEIEHFFEQLHCEPNVVAETQDTSLMKSLALEGRGLMVITEMAVRSSLEKGELVKIGDLGSHMEELWLISAQRKIQNPVANHLMKDVTLD